MVDVKVKEGLLRGEVLDTVTGDGQYYSFKGIPYAKPPLGKLRFKGPQPPVPWQGIRQATEHGSKCPQADIFTGEYVAGSEDCLYLNVYSPNMKPASPLPVMFFIHGGGFKSGSGDEDHYGPDFLVSHGVVLVTINYRLEVLGFLCLDTEEVPGNAGLKDQVAALKWVKENITNFGGDPNNITIFGESAGGASTALHVISPMSRGLFNRAICMSGVPICDWAAQLKPQKRAFVLGKQLGIETDDPQELLDFLQGVPVQKLCNVSPTVISFETLHNNILKMYHFIPVVEKQIGKDHFLTEDPLEAIQNKRINDVDVLTGYTSEECLVVIDKIEILLNQYNTFPELLVPRRILMKSTANTVLEISEMIHKHYFNGKPINLDKVKEFVKFTSHTALVYDINRFMSHLPKVGASRRFMYIFSCVSERNVYGNKGLVHGIEGAGHLDDLMYLFDAKKFNLKMEKDSNEYKLVNLACKVFTNFAKYGNPTPDDTLGVVWPEYDNVNKKYVDIGDVLTPGSHPDEDVTEFWKSIFEYAGLEY